MNIYIETLGCPKNFNDSEVAAGILVNAGHRIVDDPAAADALMLNTCGFIEDAKTESIAEMFRLAQMGRLLIVSGCLIQRYSEEMYKEVPEVDIFLGVNDYDKLPEILANHEKGKREKHVSSYEKELESPYRRLETVPYTATLKIAEGCDNHCTYCAIPNIRGRHRSRSPEVIIKEAQTLYDSGVRELILVAQNLTQYGSDLDGDMDLADLLDELAGRIPFTWIRLLYMYPEGIDAKLLDVINAHDNICHYFDMPIQHTEDEVLHRMGRRIDKKEIYGKVNLIREKCPDAVLRTTVIAGFPGESEAQFNAMLETLNDLKFERLGAFAYSQEEGTPAAEMPDQIDDAVKEERVRQIYERQEAISTNWNTRWIDQEMTVLIDEIDENGIAIGRTRGDAPEIDGDVIIETSQPEPGHFYRVKIVDAIGFDLIGEVINESTK